MNKQTQYSCIQKQTNHLSILVLNTLGYTTNTLTNANVGIGKSSLDSHSHFRQSGEYDKMSLNECYPTEY